MKIFFTGSVRGGRATQPTYEQIILALKRYGEVLSQHVSDETISEHGETELSSDEISSRELAALAEADIMVAEVSTPSLGVGNLIARASLLGMRVVALYHGEDTSKLSALIQGDENVSVYTYTKVGELPELLRVALQGK